MKVAKFGGSSMADATQVKKVSEIIKQDDERKIIVVSAAGKRNSSDSKITDLLYLCGAHVKYGQDCAAVFNQIKDRYLEIAKILNVECNLEEELTDLKEKLDNDEIEQDELVSKGEYFSAKIIAKYLGYKFIDSTECIKFNFDKKINIDKTYKAISKIDIKGGIVVPGFYGSLPNGKICTFSRGGSDITASLLAAALNVDIYENWTDVSGILIADPSIVKNPETIRHLTFEELRLLSCYGARVLHEGAVYPVRRKNIPLNIRNTNSPDEPGSIIQNARPEMSANDRFITGITGKKGFSVIVVSKQKTSRHIDDLAKVLKVIQNYNLEVDYIHNGVDSVSFAIQENDLGDNLSALTAKLQDVVQPDNIKVYEDVAIIAAVGKEMASLPGVAGRIFGAIGKEKINIRIINQGPEESTIVFGVNNNEFEKVIQIIYDVFVI